MCMKTLTSHSLEETANIAGNWLLSLEPSDEAECHNEAVVVGLSGHLGSGKTTFTQFVAKALGVDETVTSPTFVIMKAYETDNDHFHRLVHIDAYRLERPEELEALNFEKLIAEPHSLILIEWPENVELKKVVPELKEVKFEIREGKHHISFM